MQRFILFFLLALTFAGCQKSIDTSFKEYPDLEGNLKTKMSAGDFANLDFSRVARIRLGNTTLLRIGLLGQAMSKAFVLVDVRNDGSIKQGRIVQLTASSDVPTYNGRLVLRGLDGGLIADEAIIDGYRVKQSFLLRENLEPDPTIELPEVVIVCSYPPEGINWGTYFDLMAFLDDGGGGGGSGWYSGGDPFAGGGGGGGSSGGSGSGYTPPVPPTIPPGVTDDPPVQIDFETQVNNPAIDLDKYLKCFDEIPDAGATCKVTIHADVPVNSDPGRMMDWSTGSPGHSWIRLEKVGANNSGSVSQHIGFYPESGWKLALTDAPVPAKFVDNGNHEFNASYELTVTPESLRRAIVTMQQLRNMRYDIDNYNCTDWALAVWQAAADPGLWFDIPLFHIPGSLSPGSSTPQGLFEKIKELHDAGTTGTNVPVVGWSGNSDGPCN